MQTMIKSAVTGTLLAASLFSGVASAAHFTHDLVAETYVFFAGQSPAPLGTFNPAPLVFGNGAGVTGTLLNVGDSIGIDATYETTAGLDTNFAAQLKLSNVSLTNEITVLVNQTGSLMATATEDAFSIAGLVTQGEGVLNGSYELSLLADMVGGDLVNGADAGSAGSVMRSTDEAFAAIVLAPGEQQLFSIIGEFISDAGTGTASGAFNNFLTISDVTVRSLIPEPTSLGLLFAGAAPLMLGRVRRARA